MGEVGRGESLGLLNGGGDWEKQIRCPPPHRQTEGWGCRAWEAWPLGVKGKS